MPRATALAGALLVAAGFEVLDPAPESPVRVSASSPRSSHRTATGTMTAYDPGARALTVENATGSTVYHVAADARAWLGRHRLPIHLLASHIGAEVTLAWAEIDGIRTTHTVRLTIPHVEGGR